MIPPTKPPKSHATTIAIALLSLTIGYAAGREHATRSAGVRRAARCAVLRGVPVRV